MSQSSPYAPTVPGPRHRGLKSLLWTLLPIFVVANVVLSFGPFADWIAVIPGALTVATIVGLVATHLKSRER
ncbi:hypothetical protein [Natronoglycomyces albus]|uniref:Uncharacterized protein n=1 Tax=Natronoglycomyces albus TaxID=2811108 RepID=A0A895XPR9_9ACTN|nr:hypothetical protein [Natronoglycomyces albus]QSB05732.1 hypothetical protein JQS30_02040 [Natronoglycomyces albus]